MVSLDQKYNLNHIYPIEVENSIINIGSSSVTDTVEVTLFEKSLALTSDLKRLPILRSISGSLYITPTIATNMQASGITLFGGYIRLYRGDDFLAEDIIKEWDFIVFYESTTQNFFVRAPDFSWDFEGGALLEDKLNVRVLIITSANVAGTAFAASRIKARVEVEIDWCKVTKEQFTEYIQEHIYARM